MGSSGSESFECGVGSIVWVRRRNGSWWPGKILGPEELSNSHLLSPRSGTPVKLLGREDASVDWYNLEKSKRVKAFRCGDFDECIERAESAVNLAPKKREKYARREDAILHALELEKQMLESQVGRSDAVSEFKSNNKSSNSAEKGSRTSSGFQEYVELNGQNALEHLSEGDGVSHVSENGYVKKRRENTMLEDDISEAPPKMRGLQEFGLRTVPSKRKFSSLRTDGDQKTNGQCHSRTSFTSGYSVSGNRISSSDERKTSEDALLRGTSAGSYYARPSPVQVPQNSANLSPVHEYLPDDSMYASAPDQMKNVFDAKRNRYMYLPTENDYLGNNSESSPTQKHASRFSRREASYPLHVSASDDNTSGFSEDTESDSSESDDDSETDSDEEMNAFTGRVAELVESIDGSEEEGRYQKMNDEELDESALADETLLDAPSISTDDGVSKWKTKGKRNIRHVGKRSVGVSDAGLGMINDTYLDIRADAFNHGNYRQRSNFQPSSDLDSYLDGDNSLDRDYWNPVSALGNSRHPTFRHPSRSRNNNSNHHVVGWEDMALEHRSLVNGYLMETREYYSNDYDQTYVGRSHLAGRRTNMLVDIDLKVRSSYPKQRVPIISLMSKLDGRAIIGHPLEIEELEEWSSDPLLSTSELYDERLQGEADYALPSVWKTARRTANARVPRPDLSSAADSGGDADTDYVPVVRKHVSREVNTGLINPMQTTLSSAPRPPAAKKPTKKITKKVSASSSQKTRTLSSFGVQQKQIGQTRQDIQTQTYSLSRLLKSESGPTTVACIPVKLVFSRLYEAVGRPPASIAPPSYEFRVNRNTSEVQRPGGV